MSAGKSLRLFSIDGTPGGLLTADTILEIDEKLERLNNDIERLVFLIEKS